MKLNNYIKYVVLAALGLNLSSCEDFLDQPASDTYNIDNFYQSDEECVQAVNVLYNSPWFDFQRAFFKVGEVLAGNYYWGSSPYLTFTVNGTDEDLINMSYSLWSVNAYANTIRENLATANASEETINTCIGECLVWKAMAYFYLVRTFGAVPIVHDNSAEIAEGTYNDKYLVEISDVYEYIIMTLEKAIELLPTSNDSGRIDQYTAKGLMAKVYLTKSGYGMSRTRNEEDLEKAAEYAKDVIDNSGRSLLENYSDVFRLANNFNEECLLSWHWSASTDAWTCQNMLQSDLAIVGFDEFGDCWGGYAGPSVDLQDAFGEDALSYTRQNSDTRRQATMMMCGDVYEYFWTDHGGFDYIAFIYDTEGWGGPGTYQSSTGANEVKHLYGNANDHVSATGVSASAQHSGLSTHLLRLSDIYLIYVEAMIGNNESTTDASALDAFYQVRHRAVSTYNMPTSVSWDDVWKERRLELACEGDRWYDYVRLSYYNTQAAIDELKNQRRDVYYGLNELYEQFYETSGGDSDSGNGYFTVDSSSHRYNPDAVAPNVTSDSFTLPFPTEDVVFNPHLMEDPIHVDVRSEYSY